MAKAAAGFMAAVEGNKKLGVAAVDAVVEGAPPAAATAAAAACC